MRVCPKCGYVDPPCWRHKRHRLLTDYCHISDLETWNPQLVKVVREKKDLEIDGYIYHLTKSGYVDRIHKIDSADGSWHEPDQERKPFGYRFISLEQRKLFEVAEKRT